MDRRALRRTAQSGDRLGKERERGLEDKGREVNSKRVRERDNQE